jgi:hypothetical protein
MNLSLNFPPPPPKFFKLHFVTGFHFGLKSEEVMGGGGAGDNSVLKSFTFCTLNQILLERPSTKEHHEHSIEHHRGEKNKNLQSE